MKSKSNSRSVHLRNDDQPFPRPGSLDPRNSIGSDHVGRLRHLPDQSIFAALLIFWGPIVADLSSLGYVCPLRTITSIYFVGDVPQLWKHCARLGSLVPTNAPVGASLLHPLSHTFLAHYYVGISLALFFPVPLYSFIRLFFYSTHISGYIHSAVSSTHWPLWIILIVQIMIFDDLLLTIKCTRLLFTQLLSTFTFRRFPFV